MASLISKLMGVTTPVSDLAKAIQEQGWQLGTVKFENKLNAYTAEAISPHGETLSKTGPDEGTAVANALLAVTRRNHMRTTAQFKVGMWRTNWHERQREIAEAYRDAPIYDPKAVAAYKALGDDSTHRLHVLAGQLHIEPTNEPQPYATADDMRKDVHDKRHYYLTRAGASHPVWTSDQVAAFRAVHDILGHGVAGGQYDWPGRVLATNAHAPLLTKEAQQALFSETVARHAFLHTYGTGPQKVALFPEFIEHQQDANNPSAHQGVHPSQSIAPVAPAEGFALTGKVANWGNTLDANQGFESGVDPMAINGYIHHGDPLQAKATMDNAQKIDTGWSNLKRGDGSDDREHMKLAIVNAFRTVLLSPRKDLRWNAIHYQDIAHIPGNVDDPKVYWETLEKKRRAWNEAQGIDPESHMIYYKFLKPFKARIAANHPEKGWEWAEQEAKQVLFDWWTEEQEQIQAEDEKKPADKQRGADEIERRANEALARRMQLFLKPKDAKADVEDGQMSMLGSNEARQARDDLLSATDAMEPNNHLAAGGQYNLLTGEEALKYGAFMGTHLKAIAQISQHADEILDAALADVRVHDAEGHHFRHQVLQLGVSGVGPKVCSFAWLLLQPMTSQLATIDTHMMDVLGHDYEKDMNNRDYFKFERQFRAGLDAAGYTHLPLGAGQWGMWDYKRTGPGSHQDHSAMRVLDPTPHSQIDWVGKAVNLKGESWLKQAPDWWQNTQPARDAAGADFDATYGTNFAQNKIPYQGLTTTASTRTGMDWNDAFVGPPDARSAKPGMRYWKGITTHDGQEHKWDAYAGTHLDYMKSHGIDPHDVHGYWYEDYDGNRESLNDYRRWYRDEFNREAATKPDEFHVSWGVPDEVLDQLHDWASKQNLGKVEDRSDLHMTALYLPEGHSDQKLHDWIKGEDAEATFSNPTVEFFPSQEDKGSVAIVIRFEGDEGKAKCEHLIDEAEKKGGEVKRFPGGYKPHITVGYADKEPDEKPTPPRITFKASGLTVSPPRTSAVKESDHHDFSYYWDKAMPVRTALESKARTLAEYAKADKLSDEEYEDWLDDHKSDTKLTDTEFKRFKKKSLSKYDRLSKTAGPVDNAGPVPSFIHPQTLEVHHGMPGQSLMEHARLSTGLSTQDVWRLLADEHVHKG